MKSVRKRTTNRTAKEKRQVAGRRRRRSGAAVLDYVLVLGVVFSLALIAIPRGRRIIELVYDMTAVWISWPFM